MPFLTVGGVTVPVALDGFQEADVREIGDRVAAFDGTLRSTVRDRKQRWKIATRWLSSAEYTSVRGALEASAPVSCAGDALGTTVSCAIRITGASAVPVSGGFRRRIDFEMEEV